jgi:hypothetical protein
MIGEFLRESHEYHNDHVEHLRTTRKGLEALGSSAQLEFSHACRPPSGPSGKGVAKSALVTSVVLTPRATVPWYVHTPYSASDLPKAVATGSRSARALGTVASGYWMWRIYAGNTKGTETRPRRGLR